MSIRSGALPALLVCALAVVPAGASTIIHFDELPANTPVNGLVFDGILFGFSYAGVASADAVFGGSDGFSDNLLSDPELGGPTSDANRVPAALTLAFAYPTTMLQFDLGLATAAQDQVRLQAFDPAGNSLPPVTITTADRNNCAGGSPCPSEASYAYSGSSLIGSVNLSFALTTAGAFALDNLTFSEVPEAASLWLMLGGAAALVAGRKFRARGRATD